jgi:hypothetical protein
MQGYRPAPTLPITRTCPADEARLRPGTALAMFPMAALECQEQKAQGAAEYPAWKAYSKLNEDCLSSLFGIQEA